MREHIDGRYIVVRVGGNTYAAERVTHTLDEVVELAGPLDDGALVEWCYVYSDDAKTARLIPGRWQRYDMKPAMEVL